MVCMNKRMKNILRNTKFVNVLKRQPKLQQQIQVRGLTGLIEAWQIYEELDIKLSTHRLELLRQQLQSAVEKQRIFESQSRLSPMSA